MDEFEYLDVCQIVICIYHLFCAMIISILQFTNIIYILFIILLFDMHIYVFLFRLSSFFVWNLNNGAHSNLAEWIKNNKLRLQWDLENIVINGTRCFSLHLSIYLIKHLSNGIDVLSLWCHSIRMYGSVISICFAAGRKQFAMAFRERENEGKGRREGGGGWNWGWGRDSRYHMGHVEK